MKARVKPTQKLAPYSCHKAIAKVKPTLKLIPYSCYKAKAKAKPVQCKNAKISSQQLLQEQKLRCEPFGFEGRADSLMGKNANAKNRTFMLS